MTSSSGIYDMIYAGLEHRKVFAERFSSAKIKDASGPSRPECFSIEDSDTKWEEYLEFLLSRGYGKASFHVGMSMAIPGKAHDRLVRVFSKLKPKTKASVRTA